MQSNKEIGKIQYATPMMVAQCVEYFIQDVVRGAAVEARSIHKNKISPLDM